MFITKILPMKKLFCVLMISTFTLSSLYAIYKDCTCYHHFELWFQPARTRYVYYSDSNGNCCTPQTGLVIKETWVYTTYGPREVGPGEYIDINVAIDYCCRT
jgi:hypothetical protein